MSWVSKYAIKELPKKCKVMCTHVHTKGVFTHAHNKISALTFMPCVGAYLHGSLQKKIGKLLLSYELKFQIL